MGERTNVLARLDGKSPGLFLIAGGLLVIFAAETGARVFADAGISAIHSFVGPAGFAFGLGGLLGLHPSLANRTPKAAHIAAMVTAIPAVGWTVISVFGIGSSAGILPGMSVVFPAVFPIVVLLTTILGYVVFGVVSLRTETHSRMTSIVLLLPAIPFLALFVGLAVLGPVAWAEFVIDSGHAVAHLAVGLVLRNTGVPSAREEPATDASL